MFRKKKKKPVYNNYSEGRITQRSSLMTHFSKRFLIILHYWIYIYIYFFLMKVETKKKRKKKQEFALYKQQMKAFI